MAMRFSQANRANPADVLKATIEQGRIASQLRQAKMQGRAGNMAAASQFGDQVSEGKWGDLGKAVGKKFGYTPPVGEGPALTEVAGSVAPEVAGSVAPEVAASVAPEVAASVAPEVAASVLPEVAGSVAPEVAASVLPGVTGGGVGSALAGIGPMGWAALAAMALAGAQ